MMANRATTTLLATLVVLLIVFGFLSINTLSWAAPRRVPEYKAVILPSGYIDIDKDLNKHRQQGWKFTAFVPRTEGQPLVALLER